MDKFEKWQKSGKKSGKNTPKRGQKVEKFWICFGLACHFQGRPKWHLSKKVQKVFSKQNRPFLRPSLLESQKVIRKLVENGQKANRPFSRPVMAFQSAFEKRIGLFKAYSQKIVEEST